MPDREAIDSDSFQFLLALFLAWHRFSSSEESFDRTLPDFYSWPLFLVAIPILMGAARAFLASTPATLLFLAMHLSLSWTLLHGNSWLAISLAAVVYPAGWLLLRRAWRTGPESSF
jgi:hypothetical protein